VYVLPVVNPVTVTGLAAPLFEPASPPSLDTHDAVKLVIALPLSAPGVKLTWSWPFATLTAVTEVGAAGEPTTTDGVVPDGALVPALLVAVAVQP
jgi:hypothetical protein